VSVSLKGRRKRKELRRKEEGRSVNLSEKKFIACREMRENNLYVYLSKKEEKRKEEKKRKY